MTGVRRALAVEFAMFAGSTAAYQASRLGMSMLAAALLPPSRYGFWGLFLALLSYTNFANLGVISGANRELPIAIGRGDARRATQVEEVAFGGAVVTGVAVATVSAMLLVPDDPMLGFLVASALGLQQLYLFYQVSLRSRLQFNRASSQQLLLAVVFAATGGLLIRSFGLAGLISAQVASFAVASMLGVFRWRPQLRPSWETHTVLQLLASGFPIMLAGLGFAVLTTADRWVVVVALGQEAVGHYTLAALVSSGAMLLATVVGQQFYPRMGLRLGQTNSVAALFPMAVRQSAIVTALVAPLVAIVVIAAPAIVRSALPSYEASVPAIQILAIAVIPLVAGSGFTNLLVASGRAKAYLLLQCVAVVVELLSAALALALGYGLVGVAVAAFAGYVSLFIGALTTTRVARKK
jgi:O-antigen/teichoic acid export membrane protein